MTKENLVGQRFGKLLVETEAPKRGGRVHWVCYCECGRSAIVASKALKAGNTRSCGCFQQRRAVEANTRHGMAVKREEHPIWKAWQNMKRRCDDPNNVRYAAYGGRGIGYDPAWRSFDVFKADMEAGWKQGRSLDRVNVNGPYSKANCRWATPKEQARNTRANRELTYRGVTKLLVEWAEALGVTHSAILYRLKQGWSVDDALSKPFKQFPKR